LSSSDHNRTDTISASRISRPPIVGVPSLSLWSGPISRIGWPTRSAASRRISQGPIRNVMNRAVNVAAAVRKVM
jgi:hypothetical protein